VTLWWNDGRPALRGTNSLPDVIPGLVTLASRVKAKQLQDSDKLEVNRIAVAILVAVLCGATSPFGVSECGPTVCG
jgi:hypothetical protein